MARAAAGLLLLLLAAPGRADELAVVSYNVHGLPAWITRDDPEARMRAIGPRLALYDVALVQEDWSHHALLAASAGHATQLRGNGPRAVLLAGFSFFCGGCGSGLSVFASLPRERVLDVEAVPYGLCADWLLGANDCWATKGFLFARLRLASGAEVDVYDTHLEAGDGEDDLAVREQQLERLRGFMAERSAGRAVILGGDLNLPYDDVRQRAVVERFASALGLRDAGARPSDGSRWEKRLDWILYRDGADVSLALLVAGEERAFVQNPEGAQGGTPLSDHPAVFARFRLAAIGSGTGTTAGERSRSSLPPAVR